MQHTYLSYLLFTDSALSLGLWAVIPVPWTVFPRALACLLWYLSYNTYMHSDLTLQQLVMALNVSLGLESVLHDIFSLLSLYLERYSLGCWPVCWDISHTVSVIILCMRPANGRRRYIVTLSLIGWAHTQNDPCIYSMWMSALWSAGASYYKQEFSMFVSWCISIA